MIHTKSEKPLCLIIRGKPSSGKTTLTELLAEKLDNYKVLDPDKVDRRSKEYQQYSPRSTRNPTKNVKMYCFLYNKAESYIKNGFDVIWEQPWSRQAEIDLTIRNFGYYLTNLNESVWTIQIEKVVSKLPFSLLILEIDVDDRVVKTRWIENHPSFKKKELERLKKTLSYFQPIKLPIPYLVIDGIKDDHKNVESVLKFVTEER